MNIHESYIKRCLELAAEAIGNVAPNPMVGCVIVYNNKIIGGGFHQEYGKAHAEVNAINSVADKELLKHSTLYVNLEPCSHYGKTPPCVDLIIKNKIPYVVIGSLDTNTIVAGRGIEKLTKAGVDVKVGILENECRELNKRFFTFHEKKRPYIILKWAQTKDGFIDIIRSPENIGKPLQITNSEDRAFVHKWRSEEQAIMVGTNTALLDNPQLTVREVGGKNPLRIAIDKDLRIPSSYHLFDKSTPTIVFIAKDMVSSENLNYIKIDFSKDIIPQILKELFNRDILSVIIEGGEKLLKSFINGNVWDEARVFISEQKINEGVKAPLISGKIKIISKENRGGAQLVIYRKGEV